MLFTANKDQPKAHLDSKKAKDKPAGPGLEKVDTTKDKSGDEEKGEKPKDKAGDDERKEKGKDKPGKKPEIVMGDVFKVDNSLMAAGPYYKVKGQGPKNMGQWKPAEMEVKEGEKKEKVPSAWRVMSVSGAL